MEAKEHIKKSSSVAEQRHYNVLDVTIAKQIALLWLQAAQLENAIVFGLPEIDDRYHIWRVPLLNIAKRERIGEVVIDAHTSLILKGFIEHADHVRRYGARRRKYNLGFLTFVVLLLYWDCSSVDRASVS